MRHGVNAYRFYLEVCSMDKRILQSLDLTVNRFFMKLIRTYNIEIAGAWPTLLSNRVWL